MKDQVIGVLGSEVTYKKGNAFKSIWFVSEGKPIVKVSNFTDSSISDNGIDYVAENIYKDNIEYILHTNDVVIQTVGSWPNNPASVVGKVVRVPRKINGALLNQNAVVLHPKAGLDNFYMYYLLKSNNFKGYIINTAQGAANQASITLDSIFRYSFFLPPLPIQRKIAAILSSYDDLIENNNRRISILEKIAEELYREWFVRLRFPGHENVKSVKGVPEGWEVKRFDEFCVLQRGFDLPDEKIIDGIYPVIASTSIKAFHNQFKVNPPVITTGRSGSLGIVLLVNKRSWPLNTSLWVKGFCNNSPLVIYYTLKNMKLENFNSGAGVPTLNRNHLSALKIIIPKQQVQTDFTKMVGGIQVQSENLMKTKEILTTTRDRLLSRLMSGKIDVENLDIEFPSNMKEEVSAHA